MSKEERIKSIIEEMEIAEKVRIHNEYCYETSCNDDEIFEMDRLDEVLENESPRDIINMVFYGDFNTSHDYFQFNGYGNLESFYDIDIDNHIYPDEISEWIVENNNSLGSDEIQEILDEE